MSFKNVRSGFDKGKSFGEKATKSIVEAPFKLAGGLAGIPSGFKAANCRKAYRGGKKKGKKWTK